MELKSVNPEQSKANFMYDGKVVEQYDLTEYYGDVVIASLTKEEYDDGEFSWNAVIDGSITECGENCPFEEAKIEFLRVVEEDLQDKINYNTELLENLAEVYEK